MSKKNEHETRGLLSLVHHTWGQLWRYTVAGLLVWIPLIITVWVTYFFVNKLVFGVEKLIRDGVDQLHWAGQQAPAVGFLEYIQYRPGLGVLIVFALFLTTGVLTRYLVGRKIIDFGERMLHRIPLIRRIYRAVQQIRDTFIGRNGAVFQKVCLVEYPKEDMLAVGFVTSMEQGDVQLALGREMLAVFVPTTPNPTSGYLVYVPTEDVIILDMSVEDAMKLIISAGAYIPRNLANKLPASGEDRPSSSERTPLRKAAP